MDPVTTYGYGRHFDLITQQPSTISMFLKLVFMTQLVYLIALNMIKISFPVLYMYIFVPSRVLKSFCIAVIVLLIMECVEEIMVVILQCQPIQSAWDPTIPGHCLNMILFYYVSFSIKLATDIAIFILPIPPLLRLRVRGLQKFSVVLMFALGLLVCVTSIIRVTYIKNLGPDHTWTLVAPLNWSAVEHIAGRVASSNRDSTTNSRSSRIRCFFLGRGKEADREQRQMSPDGTARDGIPLSEGHVRAIESVSSDFVGEV
ncbi:hypothetical protein Aspvir_002260 [Aspergillus viridinutans]|uniref:Rhodopsin domain-containing protein n=1 Tax=Aspergillus viridinutans TaxID=75553 RepID=A0A9P3F9T4_ASPVI|nr:uncharacterized protein Aspvir_002260 [Aspergillus viridinutans]GIK06610.1 hypothetical protein Aspvir_002260 [Aspergillus viridinutans]